MGIVAEAKTHPLSSMNTFERALAWIAHRRPAVHETLTRVLARRPDALMDFAFFRDFSYGCKEVFSARRWVLTGEAAWFPDPFYSPGLRLHRDRQHLRRRDDPDGRRGRADPRRGAVLRRPVPLVPRQRETLSQDQYALFGSERVMPVEVLWDYTYYWGVLCQLFFQRRLTDRAAIVALREPLQCALRLNEHIQATLRAWGRATSGGRRPDPAHAAGTMLDQSSLPWFAEINRGLRDVLDDAGFRARIVANVAQLEALAAEIDAMAARDTRGRATAAAGRKVTRAVAPADEDPAASPEDGPAASGPLPASLLSGIAA